MIAPARLKPLSIFPVSVLDRGSRQKDSKTPTIGRQRLIPASAFYIDRDTDVGLRRELKAQWEARGLKLTPTIDAARRLSMNERNNVILLKAGPSIHDKTQPILGAAVLEIPTGNVMGSTIQLTGFETYPFGVINMGFKPCSNQNPGKGMHLGRNLLAAVFKYVQESPLQHNISWEAIPAALPFYDAVMPKGFFSSQSSSNDRSIQYTVKNHQVAQILHHLEDHPQNHLFSDKHPKKYPPKATSFEYSQLS